MADNRYNNEDRIEAEAGTSYTSGDYDPSEIDTRDREYYAYGADHGDATPEPGITDTETYFEDNPRHRSTYFRQGEVPGRRPKEQILEDINHRLIYDDAISADNIQVGVNDGGEVTLQGTVKSYIAWRTLQGVVQEIPGVTKIRNRLRIQPNGAPLA